MTTSRFVSMSLNERLNEAGLMATFDAALATRDRQKMTDILIAVDTDPGMADVLLGEAYSCWFCGQSIEKGGPSALTISLADLWSEGADLGPAQVIYSHFSCAEERMKGASMSLEADILFPGDDDT